MEGALDTPTPLPAALFHSSISQAPWNHLPRKLPVPERANLHLQRGSQAKEDGKERKRRLKVDILSGEDFALVFVLLKDVRNNSRLVGGWQGAGREAKMDTGKKGELPKWWYP